MQPQNPLTPALYRVWETETFTAVQVLEGKRHKNTLSDKMRDWMVRELVVGSDPALRNPTLQLGCT